MNNSQYKLFVLLLLLLCLQCTLAVSSSKNQALIDAEEDLQRAKHISDRSKKLIWELNAHIDQLGKRIRTGRTLQKTLVKKPEKDPFGILRESILANDLKTVRTSTL